MTRFTISMEIPGSLLVNAVQRPQPEPTAAPLPGPCSPVTCAKHYTQIEKALEVCHRVQALLSVFCLVLSLRQVLTTLPRLTSNLRSPCLSVLGAGSYRYEPLLLD